MQPAVLEFDEAVQVPWRPPLAGAPVRRPPRLRPVGGTRSGTGGSRSPARRGTAVRVPVGRPWPAARAADAAHGVEARRPAAVVPPRPAARPLPRVPAPGGRAAGTPAPRRPLGRGSVRLTRRGRLLLVVVSLAVGLAAGALLASWWGGGADGSLRLVSDNSVVVRPGDTLWSLAASVAGGDDVRDVVARIQEVNHLHGTALHPGDVLRLP